MEKVESALSFIHRKSRDISFMSKLLIWIKRFMKQPWTHYFAEMWVIFLLSQFKINQEPLLLTKNTYSQQNFIAAQGF